MIDLDLRHFFHASFVVKRCQFALLMSNFVIVVWGSDFCFDCLGVSHSGRYFKDCM